MSDLQQGPPSTPTVMSSALIRGLVAEERLQAVLEPAAPSSLWVSDRLCPVPCPRGTSCQLSHSLAEQDAAVSHYKLRPCATRCGRFDCPRSHSQDETAVWEWVRRCAQYVPSSSDASLRTALVTGVCERGGGCPTIPDVLDSRGVPVREGIKAVLGVVADAEAHLLCQAGLAGGVGSSTRPIHSWPQLLGLVRALPLRRPRLSVEAIVAFATSSNSNSGGPVSPSLAAAATTAAHLFCPPHTLLLAMLRYVGVDEGDSSSLTTPASLPGGVFAQTVITPTGLGPLWELDCDGFVERLHSLLAAVDFAEITVSDALPRCWREAVLGAAPANGPAPAHLEPEEIAGWLWKCLVAGVASSADPLEGADWLIRSVEAAFADPTRRVLVPVSSHHEGGLVGALAAVKTGEVDGTQPPPSSASFPPNPLVWMEASLAVEAATRRGWILDGARVDIGLLLEALL